MRPSSAKAKGRRHQQRIVRDILAAFPELTPDDVRSTSMGASGEDVLLSPAAQRCVPLSIEAKNTERLNVWTAIEQAESNCPSTRTPCVVFTRNHAKAYAVVPWEMLLRCLRALAGTAGAERSADASSSPPVASKRVARARTALRRALALLEARTSDDDDDEDNEEHDVDDCAPPEGADESGE